MDNDENIEEDNASDSAAEDDVSVEDVSYDSDEGWTCPVDEDSLDSSDDDFFEPEKQRNHIGYVQ